MKKVLFLITVSASLFIIKDLIVSIYTLWHKNDLLIVAQKQLTKEKKENMQLKASLSHAQNPAFVEEEARNKLFLVKSGERVVLLPSLPEKEKKQEILTPEPNWKQWYELFFP